MMKRKAVLFASVLGVLAGARVFAQEKVPSAHISIVVTDMTNARVVGAQVKARPRGGNLPKRPIATKQDGTLTLDLSPGTYDLFVTSPAFKPWSRVIHVQQGINPSLTAILEIADHYVEVSVETPTLPDDPNRAVKPPGRALVIFTVKDQAGLPLPYAQLFGVAGPTATADANGELRAMLLPGRYDVAATSPGFARGKQRIEVQAGREQSVIFTLGEAPAPEPDD